MRKFILKGAGIAFVLTLLFLVILKVLSGTWVYSPLLIVTIGGAIGGILFYLLTKIWFKKGQLHLLSKIFAIILYLALLWVCLVIALAISGLWD